MNILGISFGSENGNADILAKEALHGAKAEDANVKFLHMADFKIVPCDGCHGCMKMLFTGGSPACVHKDDFPLFFEQLLWADGVIFVVPAALGAPNGLFRNLCDRMPTYDVAGLRKAGVMRPGSPVDQRIFNHRAAGFICVCESKQDAPLGLSMMPNITHCLQMDTVDAFMADGLYAHGQVVEHDEHLKRAASLGMAVAKEAITRRKERTWHGDAGFCPVCHNDLFVIDEESEHLTCCSCAIDGKLVKSGSEYAPVFSPMQLRFPRSTEEEMLSHHRETDIQMGDFMTRRDELLEKAKPYVEYDVEIVKPAHDGR